MLDNFNLKQGTNGALMAGREKLRNDVLKARNKLDIFPTEAEVPTNKDKTSESITEEPVKIETMEMSTSYIANGIDYVALQQLEQIFAGQKIRVSISIERV